MRWATYGLRQAVESVHPCLLYTSFFLSHFTNPLPEAVLLRTANTSAATSRAIDHGLDVYPNLKIQTRPAFQKSQQAQVNQLLGLVYALLALAVVIAPVSYTHLDVYKRQLCKRSFA